MASICFQCLHSLPPGTTLKSSWPSWFLIPIVLPFLPPTSLSHFLNYWVRNSYKILHNVNCKDYTDEIIDRAPERPHKVLIKANDTVENRRKAQASDRNQQTRSLTPLEHFSLTQGTLSPGHKPPMCVWGAVLASCSCSNKLLPTCWLETKCMISYSFGSQNSEIVIAGSKSGFQQGLCSLWKL